MRVIFERCQDTHPEILQMAREIMERFHDELKTPDGGYVQLCIMLALRGGEHDGKPLLMLHNWPAAAYIKPIPYKQRVDKRADVEITIDGEWWEEHTDRQRQALLDHEITHIEIERDEYGAIVTDDVGRPKVKMKPHDYELAGFRSIAKRYRADALEVIEARHFQEDYGRDVLQEGGPALAPAQDPQQTLIPMPV